MDTERTMQFILEQQASFAVKLDQMREETNRRIQEHEARIAHLGTREEKAVKQFRAIRTLIKMGMKLLVEVQEQQKLNAEQMRVTDANLQALIDSLRRGSNGKSNGKSE